MEESKEIKNFFVSWCVAIASLCYCYFIASKVPKGFLRLLTLLPILYLFFFCSLSLYGPWSTLIFTGFITWVATFKLLLYTFNLGPLSTKHPDSSLLKFIILAALPVKLKLNNNNNNNNIPNKKQVIPLNYWSKCLLFVLFNAAYSKFPSELVLSGIIYLFLEVAYGPCYLLVWAVLGFEIETVSDEPYLSTSLQDFWGRRWNLMVSHILRHTIYKPVRSLSAKFLNDRWAPVPGVMASFLISGLMHEFMYYCMIRVEPTWEVTSFFVLQGVCVVLEIAVKRDLGLNWSVPWAIASPLTVGFVIVTAFWLLFPHFVRNHVDVKATDDVVWLCTCLKEVALDFKTSLGY